MKSAKSRKSEKLTDQTDNPIRLFKYYCAIARDPKRTELERASARRDAMDVWSWMPWDLAPGPHIENFL